MQATSQHVLRSYKLTSKPVPYIPNVSQTFTTTANILLCSQAFSYSASAFVAPQNSKSRGLYRITTVAMPPTLNYGQFAMQSTKTPSIPRPSASVVLISPTNQVLLLQRVKQSSSFPSAHVFPGGNLSPYHETSIPAPDAEDRHRDSEVYRLAAVRETFEESGILLARDVKDGSGRLLEVAEVERDEGRRSVHADKIPFSKWLAQKGGQADLDGLIPFTRWVTPPGVPKRFTTQMYLYFLPLTQGSAQDQSSEEVRIPTPTTDGGLEHTTARFLPAAAWLRLAQEGRVILFPPQFFLLHQVAQHLDALSAPTAYSSISREAAPPRAELEARRQRLREFVLRPGEPAWRDMCMSPLVTGARDGKPREDGRLVLGLNRPGPELEAAGSRRRGCADQWILVEFKKDGPRRLAVVGREEALGPVETKKEQAGAKL